MKRKYYVCYGSNLHEEQMLRRCPDAAKIGSSLLPGWRLVFSRVASIVPDKAAVVPVGLWRISETDEAQLDIYEGVRSGLYYKRTLLVPFEDRRIRCMTYIMTDISRVSPPSTRYVRIIAQGYRDFNLPTKFLCDAVRQSIPENA